MNPITSKKYTKSKPLHQALIHKMGFIIWEPGPNLKYVTLSVFISSFANIYICTSSWPEKNKLTCEWIIIYPESKLLVEFI